MCTKSSVGLATFGLLRFCRSFRRGGAALPDGRIRAVLGGTPGYFRIQYCRCAGGHRKLVFQPRHQYQPGRTVCGLSDRILFLGRGRSADRQRRRPGQLHALSLAAILLTLALLPLSLTRMEAPAIHQVDRISIFTLARESFTGVAGALTCGVMIGGFMPWVRCTPPWWDWMWPKPRPSWPAPSLRP